MVSMAHSGFIRNPIQFERTFTQLFNSFNWETICLNNKRNQRQSQLFEPWLGPRQLAAGRWALGRRRAGSRAGGGRDEDAQLARPAPSSDCLTRSPLLFPAGSRNPCRSSFAINLSFPKFFNADQLHRFSYCRGSVNVSFAERLSHVLRATNGFTVSSARFHILPPLLFAWIPGLVQLP